MSNLWATIVSDDFARLVPLLFLMIGLFAVISRAPLIDRIRARDEAAREAGRLLGQLQGRLMPVFLAMHDWRCELEERRWILVRDWVEGKSGGAYTWLPCGGIQRAPTHGVAVHHRVDPPPWATGRHHDLRLGCERLVETVQEINDAGLYYMAARSVGRIRGPLQDLGLLDLTPTTEQVLQRMSAPCSIAPAWARKSAVPPVVPFSDIRALERYESTMENEAFARSQQLDIALAELHAAQRRVAEVLDYLTIRIIGTTWTRVLSAVVK